MKTKSVKVTCVECGTVGQGTATEDNSDLLSFKCNKCGISVDSSTPMMKGKIEYIRIDEFGNELDEFGNIVNE